MSDFTEESGIYDFSNTEDFLTSSENFRNLSYDYMKIRNQGLKDFNSYTIENNTKILKKLGDTNSLLEENKIKILDNEKELNNISEKIDNLNNDDVLKKLSVIEKKSDNEELQESFQKLSNDLVTTINNNNTNNISLLIGVIIGLFVINAFFATFNKKI